MECYIDDTKKINEAIQEYYFYLMTKQIVFLNSFIKKYDTDDEINNNFIVNKGNEILFKFFITIGFYIPYHIPKPNSPSYNRFLIHIACLSLAISLIMYSSSNDIALMFIS